MTGVSFPYENVVLVRSEQFGEWADTMDRLADALTKVNTLAQENAALKSRGDRWYRSWILTSWLFLLSFAGLFWTWVGIWLKLI